MTLKNLPTAAAVCALFFSSALCSAQDGLSEYDAFWSKTDQFYANPETTPLPPDNVAGFDSIPRYSYNSKFRVTARVKLSEGAKPQSIETTTQAKRRMQKAGELVFEIDSEEITLPVYRDLTTARMKVKDPVYFLPFTDLTNGAETYGGGRYIDLDQGALEGESTIVDFNRAYNPFCVYNPEYSCPIPPPDNHIETRIEAGARVEQ